MELRVLHYFLTVAREQSISGAAEYLHLSQPTLSRQLKDLETELGKQLFIRGNRQITLTNEGMLLRKRAEEILSLVQKTEDEISSSDVEEITGDVHIGAGETDTVRLVARAAQKTTMEHPGIHFHIVSGDSVDILDHLDKGLYDLGILIGNLNLSKYETFAFPCQDTWGILMSKNSPLVEKETIEPKDLWDKPLILSRQIDASHPLSQWIQKDFEELNIIATYNLIYNASLMVKEGLGYALSLEHLINTSGDSDLCFRPLANAASVPVQVAWKKYQIPSRATDIFLKNLQEIFSSFPPPQL